MIAGLVAADLAGLFVSLYRGGIAPDGLCWLTECDGVDPAAVAGLIAAGSPAGLAPVLATTVPEPAARIAGQVDAAIFHRLADPRLAAQLAPLTGTTIVPLGQVLAQGEPAGTGGGLSAAAGAGHAVALGTMEVPVVQAATLCALRSGDFVLVTGMTAGARAAARWWCGRRAAASAGRCRRGRNRRPAVPPRGSGRDGCGVPARPGQPGLAA